MNINPVWLGLWLFGTSSLAWGQYAIESTDVADAADVLILPDRTIPNPFDLRFHTTYDILIDQGVLQREWINLPNRQSSCSSTRRKACGWANEIAYRRVQQRQWFRLDVGLYHDLALMLALPLVLRDETQFAYAQGMDAGTSSVDPQNNTTLFPHNLRMVGQGLGHLALGIRWGWLNQIQSPGKPAWLVFLSWHHPITTKTNDLQRIGTPEQPVPVGDGLHWLQIGTAFSRRMGLFGPHVGQSSVETWGLFEPYFRLEAWLPITDDKMTRKSQIPDTQKPFLPGPSLKFEGNSGLAIVPWEHVANNQRLVIDLGTTLRFQTAGRDDGMLAMALLRPLYHESFVQILMQLGITVQPIGWLRIQLGGQLGFTSTHLLTNEVYGQDNNGDGLVQDPDLDPNPTKDNINPYYCGHAEGDICNRTQQNIDQIGYRFRDHQRLIYGGWATVTVLF